MDPATAREVAHYSHLDERDRFGEPRIEHVERVAAAVPADTRSIAYLHDVLEWTSTSLNDLRAKGLTDFEEHTIELLTREPGETFEAHALRVAAAGGYEGYVARLVRIADLDDHLAQRTWSDDTPPYAWARRRVMVAHEARGAIAGAA